MSGSGRLKTLYLVHDVSDAAVHRRIATLRDGGADVTLAGFRRTTTPVISIADIPVIDFGPTENAKFLQRILSVLKTVFLIGRYRKYFADADVMIARNLEMLAIGVRGKRFAGPQCRLVYEVLDIHRLLLNQGPVGKILRALEGWLAKRASALLTSSPAFVEHYFNKLSACHLPVRLVENKIYDSMRRITKQSVPTTERPAGPPWRIGWFGAIRCRKSLALLTNLAQQNPGKIEVVIRGKPALDQFDDFHKQVTNIRGLQFLGAYKNPDDLQAIYQDVHFTWAIDFFEEGLNSSWLLPNRLYEGGAFAAVPLALADVETGRFLERLGIGVRLSNPLDAALSAFFSSLTPQQYNQLQAAAATVPRTVWIDDETDCHSLVDYLRSLKVPA